MSLEPKKETEIVVTIDEEGRVSIEVLHGQGPSCTQLTQPYTDMFEISDVQHKPEYQRVQQRQQNQQRQR